MGNCLAFVKKKVSPPPAASTEPDVPAVEVTSPRTTSSSSLRTQDPPPVPEKDGEGTKPETEIGAPGGVGVSGATQVASIVGMKELILF